MYTHCMYFLCLINNQTVERNILTLKARCMNMSVEELKRKLKELEKEKKEGE